MPDRHSLLILLFSLLLPLTVAANPGVAARHMTQPAVVGSGQMQFLLWDIYRATLYAPQGRWQEQPPYALTLRYHREFQGADIATRSAQEIEQLGFKNKKKLIRWQQQMQALFPDVQPADTLTGVHTATGETIFYHNGQSLGQINDPEFSRWFFGIWLNPATREPTLRQQLLGRIDDPA
ncbi:MAG: chalcone isomerase family protein [Pseudomonadota bacterium]